MPKIGNRDLFFWAVVALAAVSMQTNVLSADNPAKNTGAPEAPPPRAKTEHLLPGVTKSFVSVPDFDALRNAWDKTQLGKMTADPVMQPFIKGLDKQIDEKLAQSGSRLGISWADVREVYGGEICIASLQPPGPKPQDNYAMAILVDVQGKDEAVAKLLAKIDANMAARKAVKKQADVAGVSGTIYELPKKRGVRIARQAVVVVHDNWLLAVDSEAMAEDIISRIQGKAATPSLASLNGFQQVMKQSRQLPGIGPAHIRLFIEPFGMNEVAKAAQRAGRRVRVRKTDRMAALRKQGFSSIEGIGGQVSFAFQNQDVLYHLFIHCPNENRVKAAEMLDFPNGGGTPLPWTPADAASVVVLNWRLLKAFRSLEPLVNEMLGDDVWDEILQGIEKDQNGPQINLERDIVAHFKDRLNVMTDIKQPIGPESERIGIAIELTDTETVRTAIRKAFQNDPFAKPVPHKGETIFDIKDPKAKSRLFNNMSIVVHDGKLIIGSKSEYVKALMDRKSDNAFIATPKYIAVENALKALGANGDAARGFTDTERSTEVNYEMMRANKLPQSRSLFAQFLNGLWPTSDEAVKRQPRIDGKLLPPFGAVKKYFKPGGFYVRSGESGWGIVGCLLP